MNTLQINLPFAVRYNAQNQLILNNDNIRLAVRQFIQNPTSIQHISNWDVGAVTNMSNLFNNARQFNESLNNWNVSNVTNMLGMFEYAQAFNQPLDSWNVSNVTNMKGLFDGARSFNQPLNSWNVSRVTNMAYMFRGAEAFNQPLDNWNVSNVLYMNYMFNHASSFDQPLNSWNVSNVTNMDSMFHHAQAFNQPLDNWNVSNVTNMNFMLLGALSFNQSLNSWNLRANVDRHLMFSTGFNMAYRPRIQEPPRRMPATTAMDVDEMDVDEMDVDMDVYDMDEDEMGDDEIVGQAFQVHNNFNHIDFQKLFQLICNNRFDVYRGRTGFKQYMFNEIKALVEAFPAGTEKRELKRDLTRLKPKILVINYDTNFRISPQPNGQNAFYTILNFVKRQPKQFQDNYIKFFILDSYQAYNTGDTTSCVKGIKERLIFSLANGGMNIEEPLYREISTVLTEAIKLSKEVLSHFIQQCYQDETIQNQLKEHTDDESGMNLKKNILIQCSTEKIQESEPGINIEEIKERVTDIVNNMTDMLHSESLSGGRKTRRRKYIIKRKGTRKQKAKRTAKRINIKRKSQTKRRHK